MILLLATATAFATTWLPEATLELNGTEDPVVLEQVAGQRHLLRFQPLPASLSAWSNGLRLDLADGPDNTVLLPAPTNRRQVELRIEGQTRIETWVETSTGDAQAWDQFERSLWQWIRRGTELPKPPSEITALKANWSARREAFLNSGTPQYRLQYSLALIELEQVRTRSSSDHGRVRLEPISLEPGVSTELFVKGPGVLDVSIQANANADHYVRYELLLEESGHPIQRSKLGASPNEEDPTLTNRRRFSAVVPPGSHVYALSSNNAAVHLTPTFLPLRPSLHSFLRHASTRLPAGHEASVRGMELGHVLGRSDEVVRIATELLNTSAKSLALARLVEHLPSAEEAASLATSSEPSQSLALALARRWHLRRDIDPLLILDIGDYLPTDPELLANISDALPAGFFRPRGLAIRQLAGLKTGADVHARWTAIWPESGLEVVRAPGLRGGIARRWARTGDSIEIQAPTVGEGRFPVLRFEAQAPVEFLLDGIRFRGQGKLGEAVSPGVHTVEITAGDLLILDGDLAKGGEAFRERPAAMTPNVWSLPDLGAPGEIELLVEGGPANLVITTSDGQAWEAQAENVLSRILVPIGPWAGDLEVQSDKEVLVAVAMRRSLESDFYTTPLLPVSDPLQALREASTELRTTEEGKDIVRLRLSRARALSTLGLHLSGRTEASAAGRTPGATPGQVQLATRLYWDAHPEALSSPVPGPTTLATAAARAGIPSPTSLEGLHRLAEHLPDRIDKPVQLALAREYLALGQRGTAYLHADQAGELGRVFKLQVAASAPWQHVARVDADGGSESIPVERRGPQPGDSVLRLAREAMLAAPWPATDYAVLRPDGKTRLEIKGPGYLELDLLCADESLAVDGGTCSISVAFNHTEQAFEIPEGESLSHRLDYGDGLQVLRLHSLQPSRHALAVRTRLDGEVLKPTGQAAVHYLGPRGIEALIAGESLLRVRVHGDEEVVVRTNASKWPIRDVGVVPLPGKGFQTIWIQGPPTAKVSLSRLLAEQPHLPAEEDAPEALKRIPPPDPVPSDAAARHTTRWMSESALAHNPTPHAMGKRGTLLVESSLGEDSTGVRDSLVRYRYQGFHVAWLQRLGAHQDWLAIHANGRSSPDGTPGFGAELNWVRQVEDTWLLSTSLDSGASGGASHLRARAEARRRFALSANWSSQPFVATHIGTWSDAPAERVDPQAWSSYEESHFFGVGLGNWLDWRPLRDGRLRLGITGLTTPELLPNWAEASARLDLAAWPGLWFALTPALGYRFVEPERAVAYWRPRLAGQISQSGYVGRQFRVSVGMESQWLPTIGTLENSIQLQVQQSPSRGLRDQSPIDVPFQGTFDLPEDKR